MRRLCALGTTLALAAFGAGTTAAQQPDTVRADTLPPSRGDLTTKYLEAQARAEERLPVLPYIGVDGPRPPLSRIVLARDSIDFLNAATVADLLQRVPGVYLWRGGWIGRPEYPNYQGRGPTSVEYLLDGVPARNQRGPG